MREKLSRSILDDIERRLVSTFEGGSVPENPPRESKDQIIEQIATVVFKQLKQGQEQDNCDKLNSQQVVLTIHPDLENEFENQQTLLHSLRSSLETKSRMNGISSANLPDLKLRRDRELERSNFQVNISESDKETDSGTMLVETLVENALPQDESAYLLSIDQLVFELVQSQTRIGRREGNEIVISDPRVSRDHAAVRWIAGRYMIFDLQSTGGTKVNNARVTKQELFPGDVISLAGYELIFGQNNHSLPDSTQKMKTNLQDPGFQQSQ
jgi:hypothetical protein